MSSFVFFSLKSVNKMSWNYNAEIPFIIRRSDHVIEKKKLHVSFQVVK